MFKKVLLSMAVLGRPCRGRCLSKPVFEALNIAPISGACERDVVGGVGGISGARSRKSIDSLDVATNVVDLDGDIEGAWENQHVCKSGLRQRERRVFLDRLAVYHAQSFGVARGTLSGLDIDNLLTERVVFFE